MNNFDSAPQASCFETSRKASVAQTYFRRLPSMNFGDMVSVTMLCKVTRTVKATAGCFVPGPVVFGTGSLSTADSISLKASTSEISCFIVSVAVVQLMGSCKARQGSSSFMWATAAPHCGPDQKTCPSPSRTAGLSTGCVRLRKWRVQPPQKVAPPARMGTRALKLRFVAPKVSSSARAAMACIDTQYEQVRGHPVSRHVPLQ